MANNDPKPLPNDINLWRTSELHADGFNDRTIASLVCGGTLVRLRRGCYIRASVWNAQKPWVRSRQLIAAHAHGTLTTSERGFVYSHTSAARLHGLFLWDVNDREHITTPGTASSTSHGRDVVAHARILDSDEVAMMGGLPCTSLEKTVVDCCLMLNDKQCLVLMDHALRLGADPEKIRQACVLLRGRNGVQSLRRALDSADARSESPGETLTRELIQRLRIDLPELQVEAITPEGLHRMDFAWRKRMLALEFDGKVKYFDYAPTAEVIYKERQREKALMEIGWRFIRIKWRDLFNEHEFKTRLLRALK
ncbi:hypothetical protein ACIQTZ_12655 [Paenarthrobacter sp. NPDC090520]|uniref:hypothetical protein n=1 Tax=Paenarthrobacter sp. NPDC090520 TaxID=3364382 RepID=UPI00380BEE7F